MRKDLFNFYYFIKFNFFFFLKYKIKKRIFQIEKYQKKKKNYNLFFVLYKNKKKGLKKEI
jgi:hypothetical protein